MVEKGTVDGIEGYRVNMPLKETPVLSTFHCVIWKVGEGDGWDVLKI